MENYLKGIDDKVVKKAAKIKLLITDVDGVLTDGGVIYDDHYLEFKKFNVKDGLIVKLLQKHGIKVGAITGRNSPVVRSRCEELGFDFHYHGVKDKREKLKTVLDGMDLRLDECAYIGDDLIDLPILVMVGLSVAPKDALPYIKEEVDMVSTLNGGRGVFREVADFILNSQGKLKMIINQLKEK
ncbi:3-deoxy-manno-octulosonate-8-phosphatase [Echinicola strongylocentroti]|uniref:3-deoxy-D-manno-octulosonate 8-phosphate phosphatase KdsC n=1 Tax=Echinicola strongylocentroti TaxID=1795355 RepID=A0A2Z4ILX8_9BACT|nr:HAD hydrolase family protein [Echinicola strongylocentroti]AWW31566.1 3-deoxy-manno-octulosonate-8-phosphatase [Echinicola strongylocentroti]